MRLVTCTLPAGATIAVHVGGRGRVIRRDDQVDLDEVLVPARDQQGPVTLAAALGDHATAHFVPVETPHPTPVARSRRTEPQE